MLSYQGLLALEGELTPILVQMVKSANMNGLLDSDSDSLSSCQHRVKARLHHILQQDAPFGPEDYDQVTLASSLRTVLGFLSTVFCLILTATLWCKFMSTVFIIHK